MIIDINDYSAVSEKAVMVKAIRLPSNFHIVDSQIIYNLDLLITRAGPRNRTGIVCVVGDNSDHLILSDKTVRLNYFHGLVDPYYLGIALSSPSIQVFITDSMTGMAASQVNISQKKMKKFLLPLPPLQEQYRIVDKINIILPHIDSL